MAVPDETILFSQASLDKRNVSVGFHTHPGVELILVTQGCCRITVDRTTFECAPDSLLIIPPEHSHNQLSLSADLINSFMVFHCAPEYFDYTCRRIEISGDPWIPRLFREVCELSEALRYELCSGIIQSLLSALREFEQNQKGRQKLHPALCRALELIEKDFSRPWSIDVLSREAGISHSYLRKLFEQSFNLSPQQYLQNFRMAHARKLLLNSYLPVTEVGDRCGYPDSNYFSRLFRKVHHCTPSEYRRIMFERPDGSPARL